ncbi:MAG: hypothetical protein P3W91_005010 [Fervidobacterium sp.]|nr:hypothetical protein [Fervidobacterium sp.]
MPDEKNKNRTMSDEERLKRQSRTAAGIGAGALLAALGLKGLAISKGRKALAPKFQELYKDLHPVFREPLLYEQSPIYRQLNLPVRPLTGLGIMGLTSSLVTGHEARRRAKLKEEKEEERKLTPEELVQAMEQINQAKRIRKIQKALVAAGAGAFAAALPLGIYSTKSILKAWQAHGGRVNAKELLKSMPKKVLIADRLAGGLNIAGAGALVGSGIAGGLATRKEDKAIADSEIKRLAKRKKLMTALATAGLMSSIALPVVGATKGVLKDLTPQRQDFLLRLKPHVVDPYLRRTSPTYARARMLGRGLGIAGLGALAAADVYNAQEQKRRRKKLEEIEASK